MFRWFANSWRSLRSTHVSQESLLLHLEGELPEAEARAVTKHLHSCWTCRSESARLQSAMQAFAETRRRSAAATDDTGAASDAMLARLRSAAAQHQGTKQRHQANGFVLSKWGAFATGAAVVAALAVTVLWLTAPAPQQPAIAASPDAADLLARARSIAVLSPPEAFEVVAEEARDKQEWRSTFAANGWSVADPLSAGAFDRWRRSLPDIQETVRATVLPDGTRAWEVEAERNGAVRPEAEQQIRAARLLLRASDLKPVRMVFAVFRKGRTRSYSVVPSMSRGTTRAPIVAPPQTSPTPTERDLVQSEFEVHYLLHRLNVCRRDFVQVRRSAHGIEVTGVVDTVERRREIAEVLEPVAAATVSIQSTAEASRRPPSASPSISPEGDKPLVRLSSQPALLQPLLEAALRQGLSRADAQKQVLKVSNRAVLLADTIKLEAWVLHQLASAFEPTAIAHLGTGQRLLLEQMLRDHSLALGAAAGDLQAVLHQIPSPDQLPAPVLLYPHGELQNYTSFLQNEANSINRISGALFAGLNLPVPGANEARAEFEARLSAVREAAAALESPVARLFAPPPDK